MSQSVEWFKSKIQSIEIANEIIEGIPPSLRTKSTLQALANLAKGNPEFWEILQDRLAGYLHSNQPPQI